MAIKRIETIRLKVPLGKDRFFSSQCSFPQRKRLLIKITTDDGLVGWGESGPYGPSEPVEARKNDALELADHTIRVNSFCPGPIEGHRIKRHDRPVAQRDRRLHHDLVPAGMV